MSGQTTSSEPFVSYSSNAEDVILHRLFGHRQHGFYVDVGAGHPTFDNDMRALYDQGWCGINFEPNPGFFAELVRDRPRDRNLQLALSDEEGSLDYWEVPGTGLSTCDADEAARARAKGHAVNQASVHCTTLAQALDDAKPASVDVLKVDVEGFELRVLQGNDWTRHRPSVILVEVTFPETPERRPDRLRPFLEQNGYDFAYFDGLNDFFVEREFDVPEGAFRPPNVFDRVLSYKMKDLQAHATALERAGGVQAQYVESLRAHITVIEQEREAQRDQVGMLQSAAEAAGHRLEQLESEVAGANADAARSAGEAARLRQQTTRLGHKMLLTQMGATRSNEQAAQALEHGRQLGEHLSATQRDLEQAALTEAGLHASIADHVLALRELRELSERGDAEQMRRLLEAMHASTSWRVTRPLRGLARLLRRSPP